jgi:uncharacterized protein (TIGR03086 family)
MRDGRPGRAMSCLFRGSRIGMSNVDLGPAARQLTDLIAGLSEGDLAGPTPCPAYTVGDLVDHIGGLALAFTAAARKAGGPLASQAPSGDASRLRPGWHTQIPADLAELAAAWQDPAAWAGQTTIGGTDAPGEIAGLAAADELIVHGWDLARATGQPYECDPQLLEAARTFLSHFASPDAPAGPEVAFGPSRPMPADASQLDHVVALAGRDPGWSPA